MRRGATRIGFRLRPGPSGLVTRGQLWSILLVTGLVLIVALGLLVLVSHVVLSMRQTANEIDDQRASAAMTAAVSALERRLADLVRDNATWDEADRVLRSPAAAAEWIHETWGRATDSYPLYDMVVVFRPDLVPMAAYREGRSLDPDDPVVAALRGIAVRALGEPEPVATLFGLGDRIGVVAAMTVRPVLAPAGDGSAPVLVLAKTIDDDAIASIARDHQVEGLAIGREAAPDRLTLALTDASGTVLAHLSWPSRKPGDEAFERHRPLLLLAGVTLLGLLILVLAAGFAESFRLQRIAALAAEEARHDALSGTLNRAGFMAVLDAMAVEAAPERPLTLYMLDLDGFKEVNDTHGHAMGDELITAVAGRLAGLSDRVAAIGRLGGDEFALVQSSVGDAGDLAQEVVDALSRPFQIGGRTFTIGASIGHATVAARIDPAELMRHADLAMYRAKALGRNRACAYHPGLETAAEPDPEAGEGRPPAQPTG